MHPVQTILQTILQRDYDEAARLSRQHLQQQPADPTVLALRSFALGNLLLGELPVARRAELEREHLHHASQVLDHLSPEQFSDDETIAQIQHAALADAFATRARWRYDSAGTARDLDEALALAIAGEHTCGSSRSLLEVQALCLLRLGREVEARAIIAQVTTDPLASTAAFLDDVRRATAAGPPA